MELHHGKIIVDSVEGEWTEFTIEIPLGRENYLDDEILEIPDEQLTDTKYLYLIEQVGAGLKGSLPSPAVNDNIGVKTIGEKQIILVVEDNEDVSNFIRDSLENDYHIEEAANGEQGFRKAEDIIPDLIIGDIMMPKMDGYEMTKKLRGDEKTFHIPVILLTAKSDQQSKLEGFESGADAFITKPFDNQELRIRIHNLIEIRKKLQEKFARGERIPIRDAEGGKKLGEMNERFINKVIGVMEKHIEEEEFSIEEFGKELCMSRTQLHRKLKALTGKSASRYLRSFRLNAARKMIMQGKGTISEIAYSVGFSSPVYFSKCFKDEFGHAPSEQLTD
jgi:YesN/AraC family two-component response regulator